MPTGFTPLSITAVSLIVVASMSGCGDEHPTLGPPIPPGATQIGGPLMTSAPPPPPGWNLREVIPTSQQQAQDTLVGYLRRTLQALPPGTVLDGDGYAGPGYNIGCDDNATDDNAPVHFQTIGNVRVSGEMDPKPIISTVGDVWRSWGWYVFERDGFEKPNQFGYAPDGYRLQIRITNPPTYPPTLEGSTPCFPGNVATKDVKYPTRLTAEG